eukprot:GSA25T00009377001.1
MESFYRCRRSPRTRVLLDSLALLAEEWKGGETISLARVFHYFSSAGSSSQSNSSCTLGTATTNYTSGGGTSNKTNVLGSSPHTDWGLLTLICADDVPGLQLFLDGVFRTVQPRFEEDLIFVNCGDFMSLLSCGKFLSPLHRVLSPGDTRLGVSSPLEDESVPLEDSPGKKPNCVYVVVLKSVRMRFLILQNYFSDQ